MGLQPLREGRQSRGQDPDGHPRARVPRDPFRRQVLQGHGALRRDHLARLHGVGGRRPHVRLQERVPHPARPRAHSVRLRQPRRLPLQRVPGGRRLRALGCQRQLWRQDPARRHDLRHLDAHRPRGPHRALHAPPQAGARGDRDHGSLEAGGLGGAQAAAAHRGVGRPRRLFDHLPHDAPHRRRARPRGRRRLLHAGHPRAGFAPADRGPRAGPALGRVPRPDRDRDRDPRPEHAHHPPGRRPVVCDRAPAQGRGAGAGARVPRLRHALSARGRRGRGHGGRAGAQDGGEAAGGGAGPVGREPGGLERPARAARAHQGHQGGPVGARGGHGRLQAPSASPDPARAQGHGGA
eukprot:3875263-Rhodomonas_salina.1